MNTVKIKEAGCFKKLLSVPIQYVFILLIYVIVFLSHFEIILNNSWKSSKWQLLLIPLLAVMLFTSCKRINYKVEKCSLLTGIPIMLIAVIITALAQLTLSDFLIELSPFIFLIALLFLLTGTKNAIISSWTIGYTVFIIIIAPFLFSHFHMPLQIMSAIIAEALLKFSGKNVVRYTTDLIMPLSTLSVTPGCSGISQLISLLAFTIPLAFIRHLKFINRMVLLLFSVIISILLNGFRISIIGFWNYSEVRSHVHGPMDLMLAPVIYPIALLFLFVFSKFLYKYEENKNPEKKDHKMVSVPDSMISFLIALAILSCLLIFKLYTPQPARAEFDLNLDNAESSWHEIETDSPIEQYRFSKKFVDTNNTTIEIRYEHYPIQTYKNRISSTFTKSLNGFTRGGAVKFQSGAIVPFSILKHTVNDSTLYIIYYCFITGKKFTGDVFSFKYSLFKNMLYNRNNSAALVTFQGRTSAGAENELMLENRIQHFINWVFQN
jgi:exosortase